MNYKLRETNNLENVNLYYDSTFGARQENDRLRNVGISGLSNAQIMDIVHGSIANEKELKRIEEINESKKPGFRMSWEKFLRTKLVNKKL